MGKEGQVPNLDDILLEKELCELLGLKKETLDGLRSKHGLPFCRVTHTQRVYFVDDVLDWLRTRKGQYKLLR